MREPPYDRPIALAAQVLAMRDHYLDVSCGCGGHRVIAIARLAERPKLRSMTLASVALRLTCDRCKTGPDEVHLTATAFGLRPAAFGGDIVWSIPLWKRQGKGGSYHLRYIPEPPGT